MATLSRPNTQIDVNFSSAKVRLWAVPLGRFLFSIIFITSGLNHFSSGTINYAANSGVPIPDILVPISGIIAIMGGLSVLIGFRARIGAILLIAFLIPVTFSMHAFWNITDPQMAMMQMSHFMKNISMLGGAILVAFYGAGPISMDHHKIRIR